TTTLALDAVLERLLARARVSPDDAPRASRSAGRAAFDPRAVRAAAVRAEPVVAVPRDLRTLHVREAIRLSVGGRARRRFVGRAGDAIGEKRRAPRQLALEDERREAVLAIAGQRSAEHRHLVERADARFAVGHIGLVAAVAGVL